MDDLQGDGPAAVVAASPFNLNMAQMVDPLGLRAGRSAVWRSVVGVVAKRIDCQGALAVYRGEAPDHVVNPKVLSHPAFLQKLAAYKAAFSAKGDAQ